MQLGCNAYATPHFATQLQSDGMEVRTEGRTLRK